MKLSVAIRFTNYSRNHLAQNLYISKQNGYECFSESFSFSESENDHNNFCNSVKHIFCNSYENKYQAETFEKLLILYSKQRSLIANE